MQYPLPKDDLIDQGMGIQLGLSGCYVWGSGIRIPKRHTKICGPNRRLTLKKRMTNRICTRLKRSKFLITRKIRNLLPIAVHI